MTPTEIAKLRSLAEKATQPSPWRTGENFDGMHRCATVVDRDGMWVADCGDDDEQANHIAACSPIVVLRLLDEIERMRSALIASQGFESKARNERDDARQALTEACDIAVSLGGGGAELLGVFARISQLRTAGRVK